MNYDLPQRAFLKGRISDIPKFDVVKELLKAGRYAKFGHAENTSENKHYKATMDINMNKCLDALDGEMTSTQIAKAVGCSQSAAYKWLAKLGELGKVDRRKAKIDGFHTILFWRI